MSCETGILAAAATGVGYKHRLIPILVLLSYHFVLGQTPKGTSQEQRQDSGAKVEVLGCLSKESGQLKLTDEDGNVFDLIGWTDWLRRHTGDELKATGIQAHPLSLQESTPCPKRPCTYRMRKLCCRIPLACDLGSVTSPLGTATRTALTE